MSIRTCALAAALSLALTTACGPSSPRNPAASTAISSDSALAQGERVYLRGAFDTARALWSDALRQSRQAHDSLGEARALTWLGLTAWRQGDYRAARQLGEAALALKRVLARDADLFKSYNALGLLAWNEGRFADATRLFGEASAAARAAGDLKSIASASGNLALVQTELGEFDEARSGFDSMRVAGRALGDARLEGNALTNLGMLAVRVGNPGAAIPLLDSARARYRDAAYPTGEQNALGQLGTAYAALGRPHLALAALDSALELSRRQGVRQDEASNLEAMAEVYRDAGNLQHALALYARAEPINRELGLIVEAGADLRSQAEIQAQLGALDGALDAATHAAKSHRAANSRFEELTDLLLLADLDVRAGRQSESAAHLAEARALASTLGVRRARAELALGEARIADRRRASLTVLQALHAARGELEGGGYGMEEEALGLEARALDRLGRIDSAAAVGRRAVAALERVRVGYGSDELKASYLADRQGVYADLADVLRRLGRTEEAFEIADASRGRTLVEGLASLRDDSALRDPAGRDLAESDELLRTIGALTSQLLEAEAELPDASDSTAAAKVAFLRHRVIAVRGTYEELVARFKEKHTPATALLSGAIIPAATILSGLDAHEALVEYQPAGDSLLIFVGRRDDLHVVVTPLPRGGLAPRVRLARELIAARDRPFAQSVPVLRGLDDVLLAPLRRTHALDGVRTLVIVPHGVLAYFPFAALIARETGRFLVQDYALVVLPSAASLPMLRSRAEPAASQRGPAILAPNPMTLPGTAVEAETIGRSLPNATILLGRAATEAAMRQALASGTMVHLAAHGELNSRNPMFSWVQTAGGRPRVPADDGRLEVHEILGLRVRSPLVFLSGCETGLGTAWGTGFTLGEDFATLARAFLYAGARNVVATLWRVDDRGAASFAGEFYRRLPARGPVQALVEAQRALLADPAYAAPYFWAGYTLAGGGESVLAAKPGELSVR